MTGEQAPVCIIWDKIERHWASGWRDITSTIPLQNAGHSRYAFRGIHMFWRGSDHSNTHSFLSRSPNGLSQIVHARQKIYAPDSCHQGLEIHAHRKVNSDTSSWMSEFGRFHRFTQGGRLPPPMPPEPAAPSAPDTNNTTGVRNFCSSPCSEILPSLLLVTGAVCGKQIRCGGQSSDCHHDASTPLVTPFHPNIKDQSRCKPQLRNRRKIRI